MARVVKTRAELMKINYPVCHKQVLMFHVVQMLMNARRRLVFTANVKISSITTSVSVMQDTLALTASRVRCSNHSQCRVSQ